MGTLANDLFLVDDSAPSASSRTSTSTTASGQSYENRNANNPAQPIAESGSYVATQQGGREGAERGASQGGAVAVLGLAMGAAFISQCFSTQPAGWHYCAMGAMSFADAASGRGAQNAGNYTGNQLSTDWGNGTGGNWGNGVDPAIGSQIDDGLAQLADAGVIINSNGSISTPDGQNYEVSDFENEEALQAKGFSAAGAAKIAQNMETIKSNAVNSAGLDPNATSGQQAEECCWRWL